jgi:RNA-directed DNA polymerase
MKFKLYRSLCESLSITRSSLSRFSEKAPNKYKVYTIPKRTSGKRVIAHPSKPLKVIQKALVKELSAKLIPHDTAFAYRENLSIKDNAMVHVKSKYLLKMDFSEFFNSISPAMLFTACVRNNIYWSDAEKRLLTSLLFWNKTKSQNMKLVLSVGAPSSPLISNFVMYEFDFSISEYCKKNKISYSRYADDITFSTSQKNTLFHMPEKVRDLLVTFYGNQLLVNKLKTRFSSKAHNRHVTGVTLTNDNKLSLGRERKRLVSALIHKYKIGIVDDSDKYYLQGLLSFCLSIEPDFVDRMKQKYSNKVINSIFNLRAEND